MGGAIFQTLIHDIIRVRVAQARPSEIPKHPHFVPIKFPLPTNNLYLSPSTMALASLRKLTTTTRQTTLSYLSQSPICRTTSTQKVSDRIIRLSAIDFQGQKHNVIGLSGQTLLKALINTGLIDPDSHRLEDIDACSAHCEINIAQEWLDKLPARSYDEEYVLKHNSRARVLNMHSRLGCQVLLNQDLQGMVVALPEPKPWDTS